jgi:hypothetical protein
MARSHPRSIRARRILFWALGFFMLFLAGASYAVEHFLPGARDPEFTAKVSRLQALLKETPGDRLVVMLGSSRTFLAFRAGDAHLTVDRAPVVTFNMGMTGGGPFTELMCLRRLLTARIHPDLLLVEVFPLLFNDAGEHPLEEYWLQSSRLRLSELVHLEPYHSDRVRLLRRWWQARLFPWSALESWAQELFLKIEPGGAPGPIAVPAGVMDEHGWKAHFQGGISPQMRARMLEVARAQYRQCMNSFHPGQPQARALLTLLDLCHQHHIPVVLVMMPEGSTFRSCYAEGLRESLNSYVRDLARPWNLPWHDASSWLPDEAFSDSHHALPSGAALFTARLVREVVEPHLSDPVRVCAKTGTGSGQACKNIGSSKAEPVPAPILSQAPSGKR